MIITVDAVVNYHRRDAEIAFRLNAYTDEMVSGQYLVKAGCATVAEAKAAAEQAVSDVQCGIEAIIKAQIQDKFKRAQA